jgi:hypothetical protein
MVQNKYERMSAYTTVQAHTVHDIQTTKGKEKFFHISFMHANVEHQMSIVYCRKWLTLEFWLNKSYSKRLAKMTWLAKFWKKISETLFQQTSYLPN